MRRTSEDLLQSTAEIEVQSKVMQSARQTRTECQTAVARARSAGRCPSSRTSFPNCRASIGRWSWRWCRRITNRSGASINARARIIFCCVARWS